MNAFGNGRRNPRMRYNGNLAVVEENSVLNARQYSLTGNFAITNNTLTGIPDPNYRAIIDTPGRRFSVDNTVIGTFNVSATVMF